MTYINEGKKGIVKYKVFIFLKTDEEEVKKKIMGIESLFKTAVRADDPLDGSKTTGKSGGSETKVSDFLTIQSLTNFAAMTGAISAAWAALRLLNSDWFSNKWVPFIFAIVFGIISLLISTDAFKKAGEWNAGTIASSIFIALINSLILFSAVVGTSNIAGEKPSKPSGDTTSKQVIVRPYG